MDVHSQIVVYGYLYISTYVISFITTQRTRYIFITIPRVFLFLRNFLYNIKLLHPHILAPRTPNTHNEHELIRAICTRANTQQPHAHATAAALNYLSITHMSTHAITPMQLLNATHAQLTPPRTSPIQTATLLQTFLGWRNGTLWSGHARKHNRNQQLPLSPPHHP